VDENEWFVELLIQHMNGVVIIVALLDMAKNHQENSMNSLRLSMPKLETLIIALIFALIGGLLGYLYDNRRYQAALTIMAEQTRDLGECKRVSEGLSREVSLLISEAFLEGK